MKPKNTVQTPRRVPRRTSGDGLLVRTVNCRAALVPGVGQATLRRTAVARQSGALDRTRRPSYLCVLPCGATQRVQQILRDFDLTLEVCAPDEIVSRLNASAHAAVVIDPAQFAPRPLAELIAHLRSRSRAAVVYAQLTERGIQDAVWFAREAGAGVVFQSHDEDPSRLVRTLVCTNPPSDAAALLARLGPALAQLPMPMRIVITAAFGPGADVESPETLAFRAGASRRSLDRWLARAGISSARQLASAPAMLCAFRLLSETGMTMRAIATITGLASMRRLRDCTVDFTGCTPREIRAKPPSVEVLIDQVALVLMSR